MIIIGDKIISSDILTEYFCCDYEKCGGVCCVIGDSGAPMEEGEESLIEKNYREIAPYMTEKGIEKVSECGFFEIDSDGDIVTPLIGKSEECAYCNFEENGSCYCAIERSHCRGGSGYVKPISCRLYPIRVSRLSGGMTALNLHRWEICSDAFKKGCREGVPVYKFLKEPLIDAFGPDFYSALEAAAGEKLF